MIPYRPLSALLGALSCGAALALASPAAAFELVPDPAFDGDGGAVVDLGGDEIVGAAALQDDGKIVVAGAAADGVFGDGGDDGLLVARFDVDGALDPSFGVGGAVRLDLGDFAEAHEVLVQPDGKIVAVGRLETTSPGAPDRLVVVRLLAGGELDPLFADAGVFRSELSDSAAFAATLQPDGRILAAGGIRASQLPRSALVARLLPDGRLDPSFGGDGYVQPGGAIDLAAAIALQPDGGIVVAATPPGAAGTRVVRLLPDGAPDPSFGPAEAPSFGGSEGPNDVVVTSTGTIVVAGTSTRSFLDQVGTLVAFRPDGTLDTSFGRGGTMTTEPSSRASSWDAAALLPGDRILVAGASAPNPPEGLPSDFALGVYGPDGWPDPSFGEDGLDTFEPEPGASARARGLAVAGRRVAVAGFAVPSDGPFDPAAPADLAVASFRLEVPCDPADGSLCLLDGRFRVDVRWRDPRTGGVGGGHPLPPIGRSGFFWFFRPDNVELAVKVLDGSSINGFYWTFYGTLTDLRLWLTVVDVETLESRTYREPPGAVCGRADTASIPAGDGPEAATPLRALALPVRPATAAAHPHEPCVPDAETLCLLNGRYRLRVEWDDQHNGGSGVGKAIPHADRTGFFWFFRPDNVELVVKVLDGTAINGHVWVFYGALSDVGYTLTVEDAVGGHEVRHYVNEPGNLCGRADTEAF